MPSEQVPGKEKKFSPHCKGTLVSLLTERSRVISPYHHPHAPYPHTDFSKFSATCGTSPHFRSTNKSTCTHSSYQNSLICCTSLFIQLSICVPHCVHTSIVWFLLWAPGGDTWSLFNLLCKTLHTHTVPDSDNFWHAWILDQSTNYMDWSKQEGDD